MKKLSTQSIGLLALLCSSAGMAATVTITPSNANPAVSTNFTLTISGSGFAQPACSPLCGDASDETTIGATLGLAITSGISYVSGAIPATGPFSGGANGGSYTPHPASGTPATFDITTAVGGVGAFDVLTLTFTRTAAAEQRIGFLDNLGTLAWFQYNDPFGAIPVNYSNGGCTIGATSYQSCVILPGPVVPAPAAAWLIAPAILAAGRFSRRRKAA